MSRYRTFGDLVDTHHVEVYRYLWHLTGDPCSADDLFQETFLRALPAFDRLRANSNHRAWIYRVATNAFLNHRRRHTRRREVPMPVEQPGPGPGAEARIDRRAALIRCRRAILALPPRQRAAFVQRAVHGLSYRIIARVLACTEAAARANVYQATRRLRRELGASNKGG